VLEAALPPLDESSAPPSSVKAPARAPRKAERAPIIRHISGSQRGGWPLFCRLLLWATRNAGGGMEER